MERSSYAGVVLPCCSAIYFLNLRGEVLIHRAYRDDVGCVACIAFYARSRPLYACGLVLRAPGGAGAIWRTPSGATSSIATRRTRK